MKIKLGLLLFIMTSLGLMAQGDITVPAQTFGSGTTTVITSSRDLSTTNAAAVVVASGANVTFKAGRKVTLLPGFRANSGSTFRAYLDGVILDSDLDGMPDTWETANGLNPSNGADANSNSSGNADLTNLEAYLTGLSPGTTATAAPLDMKVHRPKE